MNIKLFIYAIILFVSAGASDAVQTQQSKEKIEVQGTLAPGKIQIRTLEPEVIHVCNLSLQQDQYVVVEIVQKGIAIEGQIIDPMDSTRGWLIFPKGYDVSNRARWISPQAGTWKLKISLKDGYLPGDYAIKWMALKETKETDGQSARADSLLFWANRCVSQSKYHEAEPAYFQALEISEKILGAEHPQVAMILHNLASIYEKQQQYAKAESVLVRALAIKEKVLGKENANLSYTLDELGGLYRDQGKYNEAEVFLKRALNIREKALASDHLEVAESLNNLAEFLCENQGRLAQAESLHLRALQIYKKNLGTDHLCVAITLNDLGWVFYRQGRYNEAESFFLESLLITEKKLGSEHYDLTYILNGLGSIYQDEGKYDKSETFFKRSLAISEKKWGQNHPNLVLIIYNLGIFYESQGKYNEAEALWKQALDITEKSYGPVHPYNTYHLLRLGELYQSQGDYNKAESYFKKALAIQKKTLISDHGLVGWSLTDLAGLYAVQKKYSEAEPLFLQSLEIQEKAVGPYHPDVARIQNNLAFIYLRQNKYNQAKLLYQKALEIWEKKYGPNHPLVAIALINLATCLYTEGQYKNESIFDMVERAIRIMNTTTGRPDWKVSAYILRAKIREKQGDLAGALTDLADALQLAENLRFLAGEKQEARSGFFEKYVDQFDLMISWQLRANQMEKAFEFAERARAGVLSQIINDVNAKKFAGIPDSLLQKDKDLRNVLSFYDMQIQKEYEKGKDVDSLKIKNLEGQYFLTYAQYSDLIKHFEQDYPKYYDLKYKTNPVNIPVLQTLLNDNTALIEYFVGDSAIHIFTITNNLFNVTTLTKDSTFLSTVESFYKSIKKIDVQTYLTTAYQLYTFLFEPITKQIESKERLIIIPHDILYKIPFEALLVEDPLNIADAQQPAKRIDYRHLAYLINNFEICYHYSATLYVNSLQQMGKITAGARHQGFEFIGFAPVFSEEANNGYILASNLPLFNLDHTESDIRSITLNGTQLNELKHSEIEVQKIVKMHEEDKKNAVGYFHSDASEDNFKSHVGNYHHVHIATHGFINDEKPQLCGVIFSQPTGSMYKEDGILYAGEIYNLDLNAELVVLSSCESGIGKLVRGEGLMAVTRGFLYSGASNIIVSLWKVSDKQTSQLMIELYRNILSGKSYSSSLREAKLRMIEKEETAFPKSWSSFVMIGS